LTWTRNLGKNYGTKGYDMGPINLGKELRKMNALRGPLGRDLGDDLQRVRLDGKSRGK